MSIAGAEAQRLRYLNFTSGFARSRRKFCMKPPNESARPESNHCFLILSLYWKFMAEGSAIAICPARDVRGVIHIPGDKSISHRYAMLAAIADGTSRFHNFSAAQDCYSTLRC